MAYHDQQDEVGNGFVGPNYGRSVCEHSADGAVRFECRIGNVSSAAELWIEHCAARNAALKQAQWALAENAALALL